MKGIILAGGHGTRLSPITKVISKQLLPIYNKPLIYYSLYVLMLAGIREILIISTREDLPLFKRLLETGSQFGVQLSYEIQEKPEGIPQAFLIGEDFIGKDAVVLCLGDNIFYGSNLHHLLLQSASLTKGAQIYACRVKDPARYGVVVLDSKNQPILIKEKPLNNISDWAITGIYFYDNEVVKHAKTLRKSSRGELEIVDLHNIYHKKNELSVQTLDAGFTWLDAGTFDSLLESGNIISALEKRIGTKICDPNELARQKKWI